MPAGGHVGGDDVGVGDGAVQIGETVLVAGGEVSGSPARVLRHDGDPAERSHIIFGASDVVLAAERSRW